MSCGNRRWRSFTPLQTLPPRPCCLKNDLPIVCPNDFSVPFQDEDPLPNVRTSQNGGTNWLSIDVNDSTDSRAWLEQTTAGKVLRVQLQPGVEETKILMAVGSQRTGQAVPISITAIPPFEYRSLDGSNNNIENPLWGAAHQRLLRKVPANYANGTDSIVQFANPRAVSNTVSRDTSGASVPPANPFNSSDLLWAWGQFLDHEIDLTPSDSSLPLPITAPADDPDVPNGTIAFSRSVHQVDESGVWQQINEISAFIDASNVYGNSLERSRGMRTLDGTGKLKTSHNGTLAPYNVGVVYANDNATGTYSDQVQFMCGDVRANENPLLTALHTLFVLEHNRLCDEFLANNPQWKNDDERLFQEARRIVIALMQHITVDHFLVELFGATNALPAYSGYDSNLQPGITTEFSTALYRVGHTMVSNELSIRRGAVEELLPLADAFFNPHVVSVNGIAPFLEGGAKKVMQKIDRFVVEALRNMLFGAPNSPANALHDLVAINLQRGADHGLPKYNDAREAYGLARKASIDDVTSDVDTRAALAAVYASVDEIDLWIGALCEDPISVDSQLGELSYVGLREQFLRLRDGDRFWYERSLNAIQVAEVQATTLADVIRRNTTADVQDNVFRVDTP